MSVEPFNRLVRLTARAFYDDVTAKGDNHQPKNSRSDNRGIAVVVLDALTRHQWIREEDLAKALHLHMKQLRRTLQILKDEKLVANDQRKETAKGAKVLGAAAAGTSDGQQTVKGGEDKTKTHTHSYWCLDYAQIYDVVRYRIHRMKKDLKDKLDTSNTVQRYMCPRCGKRYSAFDALLLGSQNDEYFQCENCNGEVVPESDKSADEEMGDGDNTKKQKREKLNNMFQKLEEQLKPLTLQLARLKDLPVPELETLQAWETRANVAAIVNDPSHMQGYGLSMPLLGDTRVEVALPGGEVKEEETGTDAKTPSLKVLPPWMIKQGMNLTKEQRGEMEQSSASADDKKAEVEIEDKKSIQDEYLKAYYAAMVKRQEQEEVSKRGKQERERDEASISGLANDVSEAPSERKVGEKSKWEGDGDDDVEWEAEPLPIGNTSQISRPTQGVETSVNEDDIDWEDG